MTCKKTDWKPIQTFDQNRTDGYVWLKGKYYDGPQLCKCQHVKFAYYASEWCEDDEYKAVE